MSYSASASLFLLLVVSPAICQIGRGQGDDDQVHPPAAKAVNHADENNGVDLLRRAEGEAAGLEGPMRAWVLWQIGIIYQSIDKRKALRLFEDALVAAHGYGADSSAEKPFAKQLNEVSKRLMLHPNLSPGLQLEADIARSIVLLNPKRFDGVITQVDPAARRPVLAAVLSEQLNENQFDKARETLDRLALEDEMPYDAAMRLMETFKPGQSAELTQYFLAALGSYRSHGPHPQINDKFTELLTHYWRRLPQDAVREAVDEVLKQAGDDDEKLRVSALSAKGTPTASSLFEWRLLQLMPMLREYDPSAAKSYQEKYPATASGNLPDSDPSAAHKGASFRPSPSPGPGFMLAAAETPGAEKAAAAADAGDGDKAMSQAASITDPNLRAQTYEYIARANAKQHATTAGRAIEKMLDAAGKLKPGHAFPFYVSAAEIYEQMDETDDAKKSIEGGLAEAGELFRSDSDDDDPNTALKAFWPSTNAYCKLLREAAHISPAWAISLLRTIPDPEVGVSAETALAGGWLGAPIGPSTVITNKKREFLSVP